ncbi:hypothetical protein MTO96_001432 [Rhipicephalus appendiculatus]
MGKREIACALGIPSSFVPDETVALLRALISPRQRNERGLMGRGGFLLARMQPAFGAGRSVGVAPLLPVRPALPGWATTALEAHREAEKSALSRAVLARTERRPALVGAPGLDSGSAGQMSGPLTGAPLFPSGGEACLLTSAPFCPPRQPCILPRIYLPVFELLSSTKRKDFRVLPHALQGLPLLLNAFSNPAVF